MAECDLRSVYPVSNSSSTSKCALIKECESGNCRIVERRVAGPAFRRHAYSGEIGLELDANPEKQVKTALEPLATLAKIVESQCKLNKALQQLEQNTVVNLLYRIQVLPQGS